MTPSRNSYNEATIHSRKFCAPSGTCFMFRVASRANTINTAATIHVTTIELVIGNPNGRAMSMAY